ncbi:hypothetical protein NDU88_004236 [Pleurodeles waltl]|uniref:Uncharacterized protein n=1 Tax=Pleurodeles waltl TaxID=8319 RepID=A0AAV7MT24_PLEWA|nr:hypothetical protein NDU88_004236 [Pleurodeles waltl]
MVATRTSAADTSDAPKRDEQEKKSPGIKRWMSGVPHTPENSTDGSIRNSRGPCQNNRNKKLSHRSGRNPRPTNPEQREKHTERGAELRIKGRAIKKSSQHRTARTRRGQAINTCHTRSSDASYSERLLNIGPGELLTEFCERTARSGKEFPFLDSRITADISIRNLFCLFSERSARGGEEFPLIQLHFGNSVFILVSKTRKATRLRRGQAINTCHTRSSDASYSERLLNIGPGELLTEFCERTARSGKEFPFLDSRITAEISIRNLFCLFSERSARGGEEFPLIQLHFGNSVFILVSKTRKATRLRFRNSVSFEYRSL